MPARSRGSPCASRWIRRLDYTRDCRAIWPRVIYRCLEKEPSARFTSMADLAAALAPHATDRRAAATIVERTRMIYDGVIAGPVAREDSTPARGFTHGRRLAVRGAVISIPVVIATICLIARPGVGPARSAASVVPSLPEPSPAVAPTPAVSEPSANSAGAALVLTLTGDPAPASVSAPSAPASAVRAGTPSPTPKSSSAISAQKLASPRPASPQSAPPQLFSPQPVSPQPAPRPPLSPPLPSAGQRTGLSTTSTRTRGQPASPDDL